MIDIDMVIDEALTETKSEKVAKSRNRGDVVFSHGSSKVTDNKDHFPINNQNQARNAIARANQYDKSPDWYKGSLTQLINAVIRSVHKKYPKIEISKKAKTKKSAEKKLAASTIDTATNLLIG